VGLLLLQIIDIFPCEVIIVYIKRMGEKDELKTAGGGGYTYTSSFVHLNSGLVHHNVHIRTSIVWDA
jgi:hypothetical protein